MRVLCCLDGTNIEEVSRAVTELLGAGEKTIGALFVIDSGPLEEMKLQRERFLRSPSPPPSRLERMREAEEGLAREVLEEGRRYLSRNGAIVELLERSGRPEREIARVAADWQADVVVICPRSPRKGGPSLGPKSVGHVARFVLDHAPCPVLLVRARLSHTFTLPPPPPPRP